MGAIQRNTTMELVYHEKLKNLIEPYFHIKYDTISGKHWTGAKVRPDFIIYPKQETIQAGFPAKYFGIEVKIEDLQSGHKKQAIELIAQAQSYMNSSYEIKGKTVYLEYVFIYPSISDLIFHAGKDRQLEFKQGAIYALERLAGRLGVGEIIHTEDFLGIRIAAALYYTFYSNYESMRKGLTPFLGRIQIGSKMQSRNSRRI
jgi:hypothetical protein